jgi:hypothetical protein
VAPFSKTILATERLRNVDHSMGSDLNADGRVSHSSHYVEGLAFWSDNKFLGIVPPGMRVGDFLHRIDDSNIVLVVRSDWSTNPISGCALIRTVPSGFENVFSMPSSLKIDPYKYHLNHQLQISNLRCKLSSYLALSIRQSTFGHSFAGLAIDGRLFKSNPLSRLTSAGHITPTNFVYQDSAAPPKERYVNSRLEHTSFRQSSVTFAQGVA